MVRPVARAVAVPAVKPEAVPVQFVKVPEVGVPRMGVTKVGDVANTNAPEPVSSLIVFFNCNDVVAANCERGLEVKASPLELNVVQFAADKNP
jgi:hypothetical protein